MSMIKRTGNAFIFASVLIILASCATVPYPRETHTAQPTPEMSQAFSQAEQDFKSGDYTRSLKEYLSYVNTYERNSLTDNALVRAGDIYLASGDLASAQNLYLKVVGDFVTSDSYDEARYKLGYAYFKSGKYTDAIEILKALAARPCGGRGRHPDLRAVGQELPDDRGLLLVDLLVHEGRATAPRTRR